MAGFLDRFGAGTFKNVSKKLRDLSNLGVRYDDMVIRNSQAIGAIEGAYLKRGMIGDESFMYTLAQADTTVKKQIAYFDREYVVQREFLRKFAMNGEIQWILDTIADEAIIQDERQFFCQPVPMSNSVQEDVAKTYQNNFEKIYTYWRFNDDTTAWSLFYQFLIDGYLAFEIICDDKNKNIIGFKELDAATIRPAVEKQNDGTFKNVWYQNEGDPALFRTLYDSQIIYISYGKGNVASRTSYVERLVRSFNLLRIMEHTRVIWNVMNSSFRLKMIVPIGSKSPQKARETLGELMSTYKEDVRLDYDSGELFINGRPNIQFYKNYMIPSKNGEQTEISVIGGEGPDLSNMDPLSYFSNKLKVDSKVPISRFDRAANASTFSFSAEGADREEIRFAKFINRLRSIFQEIITKPLYLQMVLDFPAFKDDELFKSQIGIRFNKDNIFEREKEMNQLKSTIEFINDMSQLKTIRKGKESQYFHPAFLIKTYSGLSPLQMKENEDYWDTEEKGASTPDSEFGTTSTDFGTEPNFSDEADEPNDAGAGGFDETEPQ